MSLIEQQDSHVISPNALKMTYFADMNTIIFAWLVWVFLIGLHYGQKRQLHRNGFLHHNLHRIFRRKLQTTH